jgi:nitrate reductase / nitrite oxidoreductase, alpha subunit
MKDHQLSRRKFFKWATQAGFGTFVGSVGLGWNLQNIENPLARYPDRDWEETYRNLWRHDSRFTFLCAPNDTHNCLLNAYVRSGVATRIGPTMRYGEATDLDGNRSTHRWDPRVCQKGLALTRRFYGDRRLRHPMVRAGFKVDRSRISPRGRRPSPGALLPEGRDEWVRVTHEEAASAVAAALENIARTYSGEEGRERLRAGLRGGDDRGRPWRRDPGAEVPRRHAAAGRHPGLRLYRFANSLALLDAAIRNVGPTKPRAARGSTTTVAYRSAAGPPDGDRPADGRVRSERRSSTPDRGRVGHELDHHQDARRALADRGADQGHADRRDRLRVFGDQQQGRRRDRGPARHHARLALGLAHVILREKLYDASTSSGGPICPAGAHGHAQALRAEEVFGGELAELTNQTTACWPRARAEPPAGAQRDMLIPEAMREAWGDYVWWDRGGRSQPRA